MTPAFNPGISLGEAPHSVVDKTFADGEVVLHSVQTTPAHRKVWRVTVRLLVSQALSELARLRLPEIQRALSGLLSMNEAFGVQAFDAFQARRLALDVAWAIGLGPRFLLTAGVTRLRSGTLMVGR